METIISLRALSTLLKVVNMGVVLVVSTVLPLRSGFAQQVKPEVVLHGDRLSFEEQHYLEGLDREIIRLIDKTAWTNGTYKYELPIRMELFFEKHTRKGTDHKYSAGIMIALRSGVQLRDRRWDFKFSREEKLHFGDPYDTFTGLMEFYILVCLGFEADRFAPLGGQPFYEKARAISESARFEARYSIGWDYRRDLINDLAQDTTYRNIRTAAYHAWAGEYYIKREESEAARSHLTRATELILMSSPDLLELRRDNHIIRFIERKNLADLLITAGEQRLLDQLIDWDSESEELYRNKN